MIVAAIDVLSPACRELSRLARKDVQYECILAADQRKSWQKRHWRRSRIDESQVTEACKPIPSSPSLPKESAASCFAKGSAAMDAGRWHEGISLLLLAQRLAAEEAAKMHISELPAKNLSIAAATLISRAYERQPALLPAKVKREGSLLLLEPKGPGQQIPLTLAHGSQSLNSSKAMDEHNRLRGKNSWRYEAWLCGGQVPRIDCRSDEGFQNALEYIGRREPVVMTNLNVMPRSSKWNIEYFRRNTTEWPGMTVLKSSGDDNRYLYYVPEQADRDMSAFKGAPRYASEEARMSFDRFLNGAKDNAEMRYYLQAALVLRDPDDHGNIREHWCAGINETLRNDCDRDLNRDRLERLQAAGKFGHWSRTQLFIGPNETLSPVHYDQYDNIFLQVGGSKHFLIFDPRAAEGLYPFPVSHPYDEYAMLDLANVDHDAFPAARSCLAGRGASVTLMPGESLYIPTHWWHHVQGIAADASWSISVNFWFTISRDICQPSHPLFLHLELELARHVEILISDNFGSSVVGAIAEALVADVDAEIGSRHDFVSLSLRNFVLFRLARLLGAESVRSFVHCNFARERFDRTSIQRALQGPRRGSRERVLAK